MKFAGIFAGVVVLAGIVAGRPKAQMINALRADVVRQFEAIQAGVEASRRRRLLVACLDVNARRN